MSGLNAQQLRFVSEYLIDLNATQAAIRAGYSAKTAHSQGQRLLKHVEAQKAIAEAQYKRAMKTETDAAFVLKRLADEVTADIADLYAEDGSIKPVKEWPLIWRQGLVSGIKVAEEGDGVVVREIKLSDRIKRLELLGKHISVNAFREQIGHGDPEGNPLPAPTVDEMSKNDIARRVAFLLAQGLHSAAK
ncbi:terminase small subunit [Sinorhizobium meliloti]|uniref:Terminase n=1 Tax=Rhizobium meliloti TaxID=382 RepID=A0A2J0Z8N6_RHIML|nr:terminase small subunit [Sinorhizobium meliloti]PJR16808.1 terminase [Sinorhizobium meliloti]